MPEVMRGADGDLGGWLQERAAARGEAPAGPGRRECGRCRSGVTVAAAASGCFGCGGRGYVAEPDWVTLWASLTVQSGGIVRLAAEPAPEDVLAYYVWHVAERHLSGSARRLVNATFVLGPHPYTSELSAFGRLIGRQIARGMR